MVPCIRPCFRRACAPPPSSSRRPPCSPRRAPCPCRRSQQGQGACFRARARLRALPRAPTWQQPFKLCLRAIAHFGAPSHAPIGQHAFELRRMHHRAAGSTPSSSAARAEQQGRRHYYSSAALKAGRCPQVPFVGSGDELASGWPSVGVLGFVGDPSAFLFYFQGPGCFLDFFCRDSFAFYKNCRDPIAF